MSSSSSTSASLVANHDQKLAFSSVASAFFLCGLSLSGVSIFGMLMRGLMEAAAIEGILGGEPIMGTKLEAVTEWLVAGAGRDAAETS